MKAVQPIRQLAKVEQIKAYLKSKSERNYIMFLIGISIGLRISDILPLKKEDLFNSHIDITEEKTTKKKKVIIPGYIKKEIHSYAETLNDGDYVVKSRKGTNRPIDRSQAYRIIREAAEHANLTKIGTHSLRKTFGYHYYEKTKNVAVLQELFNHGDPQTTLIYIGINQDGLDKAMNQNIYK